MEHRAVRRGAAAEVVPLHDALKALAAADPNHVDAVTVGEHAPDQHVIAGLQRGGVCRALGELHFAAQPRRRHVPRLLVVATERLVDLRRLLLDQPELHRFVAVGLRALGLQHHARARLDDGRGRDRAVSREQLGHSYFASDDPCNHNHL
jgi:hypothetical protein